MNIEDTAAELTKKIIHSHFDRKIEPVMKLLDENVTWIGPCDFQKADSAEEFRNISEPEYNEKPFVLDHDEYNVTACDENMCVVSGSCCVAGVSKKRHIITAKLGFTFVWLIRGEQLKAVHIHVSNTKTSAAENENNAVPRRKDYTGRVSVKAKDKKIYSISPEDVLYIKAEGQYSKIFLKDGRELVTRISLSDMENIFSSNFIRAHKSYVVNAAYVVECKYVKILLVDVTIIPASKERFSFVKRFCTNYRISLMSDD